MKKLVIVPIAVLLSIGIVGCTKAADNNTVNTKPTTSVSSTATPAPEPTVETQQPAPAVPASPEPTVETKQPAPVDTTAKDKIEIAVLYQNFYAKEYTLKRQDVEAFNDIWQSEGITKPTADDYYKLYSQDVPQTKYINSAGVSEANRIAFYQGQLGLVNGLDNDRKASVVVPADGITVTGDTAALPVSKLNAKLDGKTYKTSDRTQVMHFVKKDGTWFMKLDSGFMWNTNTDIKF